MAKGRGAVDGEEATSRSTHKSLKTLLLIYMPPWLAWLAFAAAAVGMYQTWGNRGVPSELVAIGVVVVTGVLTAFVNELAGPRSAVFVRLARGTVVAVGGWLTGAFIFGPIRHPWVDLWLLGGPAVCVFWMVRRAVLSSKGEGGAVSGAAAALVKVLDGARLSNVTAARTKLGTVVKVEGEVVRGEQTVKDVQGKSALAEGALGLRPGSVLTTGHPDDAGRFRTLISPTDLLSGDVLYQGPDRPGESIAVPIRLGPYIDAEDCEITLPGVEGGHNLAHILTQGVTGAGKSALVKQLMAKALCRREVCVFGSDPTGRTTLGPFIDAQALELYSLTERGSRTLLNAVLRTVKPRNDYLDARSLPQWASGCGLSLIVLWLEEANWATQSEALTKLSEEVRKAGIVLVVSQQRASYTKTDTDLRANLTAGICMGVSSPADAKFALSDELVDLVGDLLAEWNAGKPGYAIVQHPSIPPGLQPKPMRSEYATNAQLRADLTEWTHVRSPLDEVTRRAMGTAYDQIRAEMAGAAAPARMDSGATGGGEPADIDDPGSDEPADEVGDDDMGTNVNPDLPGEPVPPDLAGVPMGGAGPAVRLSQAEARAVVQRHLRAMLAAGQDTVRPADIVAMKPPTTMSREWVRLELVRLSTDPEPNEIGLNRDEQTALKGAYLIVEPAAVGSGG